MKREGKVVWYKIHLYVDDIALLTYKIILFKAEEIFKIFPKSYQKKLEPTLENQFLKDLPRTGEKKGMLGQQEKSPD